MEMNMKRHLIVAVAVFASAFAYTQDQKEIRKTTAPHTSPASGKDMFNAYCASCHGKTGTGNGPAASALKTAPADLTALKKNNGEKFPFNHVYQSIKDSSGTPAHGSADMPVWGPVFLRLSDSRDAQVQQRIENLTRYIESLQK